MSAPTVVIAKPPRRRPGRLLVHQVQYELLAFWRNPQSVFFTFAFPVLVFVIFGLVFKGADKSSFGGVSSLQYYASTIAALSVVGSCYSQLAISLSFRRQAGILKRLRATPLPRWVYLSGLLILSVIISAVQVAIIIGIGALYGLQMPTHWPAIALSLVLGAAAFCALGIAVASVVRNADAAPAVVQFIFFPLVLLSGTYFPIHSRIINDIAGALPVRPFNLSLLGPFALNHGVHWPYLLVLVAWGAGGGLIALWRFRWEPST